MKKLLFIPIVVAGLIMIMVITRFTLDKKIDYDVSTDAVEVPEFSESVLDFEHRLDNSLSLPSVASAIIDINNDGNEELFIGGGPDQEDVFYEYRDGSFHLLGADVLTKTEISDATFGASVIDADKNGFSDLIISRTNGVWLYLNDNGQFNGQKLDLPIPADTSPLSVAIADINRDG
ncbi:MAG: hypothetical protein GQ546_02640, partial [Gammaproteobacteria bacterium]|nr:hypothetical protein [Gammaproteobacteria bacterium]